MIFLDTSAIYALADQSDPRHQSAKNAFRTLLEADEEFLTHNYVLVESLALIQNRLGLTAALQFAHDRRAFTTVWVDEDTHEEAVAQLARRRKRQVSFVDQVSFLVMRRQGIRTALAFDPDFEDEGFRLYRGSE